MGIFIVSYGTSYTVTDGEIQFVYYGNVEATFDINGDRLELKLKKGNDGEEKTRILEKVQE